MSAINVIDVILNIYFYILITYIFATWMPNVDWNRTPWKYLESIACAYLGIFERYLPCFGCIIAIVVFRYFHIFLMTKLI